METLIKAAGLKKVYMVKTDGGQEEITAIDHVDMEVFQEETFGVIGESGSGKTTLGKAVIKLVEPTAGDIYFREVNLLNLSEKKLRNLRKHFQIIFQDPYRSLNPRISIGNAVAEGVTYLAGKDRVARAKELLEMVGIEPKRYGSFPHQFSGGERQRIAIARALSTNPELIVCDEPTSNLDLSIQAKILNLFIELKEKLDLTYLFITHNLRIIEFIADRVAVMHRGKIVEVGNTRQITQNPRHPYTKTLIAKGRFQM